MGTVGSADDTATFTAAVAAGGDYWVPKATYRLNAVTITGNTRFWFETGTVLKAPTSVVGTLPTFTVDGGGSRATDWGLLGSFTIDYSDRAASEKRKGIYVRNCLRGRIGVGRMIHGASSSSISAVSAGAAFLALAENLGADSIMHLYAEYLESVNAPYGYGTTQFSGGIGHCRFGTLVSDAGVPFRLESDGGASFPNQAQDVHDIYVDQVILNAPASGGYGNSAILIANHGANVRDITVGRVDAKSSVWGIAISDSLALSQAQITGGGTGGGGKIRHVTIKSGRLDSCGDGVRRTATTTDFATEHPISLYDIVAINSTTGTYNKDAGATLTGGGRGFDVINAMQLENCKAVTCASYGFADTLQAGVRFTDVARLRGCRVVDCQTGAGGTAAATVWNNLTRLEIDGLEVIDTRGTPKHSYAIVANGSPYPSAIYVSNLVSTGQPNSNISGGAAITYTDASNVSSFIQRSYGSGRWTDGMTIEISTAAGGTAMTLNKLQAVPFDIEVAQTFQDIGVEVQTAAAAGGVIRLGVYTNSANTPLALVAGTDTGALSATVATAVLASSLGAWTFSGGVARYWLAFVSQVAACSTRVRQNTGSTFPAGSTTFPASSVPSIGFVEGGTATTGALPSSFPSGNFGQNMPRVMLKAA